MEEESLMKYMALNQQHLAMQFDAKYMFVDK